MSSQLLWWGRGTETRKMQREGKFHQPDITRACGFENYGSCLAGDQAPTQYTAAGRAATGGCDDDSATAPACGPPPRWQLRRRWGPPASHPQRRRVDRPSWEEDGVVDGDVVRGHCPTGPQVYSIYQPPTSPTPRHEHGQNRSREAAGSIAWGYRRRALIHAVRATESGSGATHHTPNVRRMGGPETVRLVQAFLGLDGNGRNRRRP